MLTKTDQYVLTKRWDRIKNPDPFDLLKTKGPYYLMVAVNQPGYMPWNAIEKYIIPLYLRLVLENFYVLITGEMPSDHLKHLICTQLYS